MQSRCAHLGRLTASAVATLVALAGSAHAERGTKPVILHQGAIGTLEPESARLVDPNEAGSPYAGVASLFVGGEGLATGAAISRWHILTAAHCFDLDNDGRLELAGDVAIFFNVAGDHSHVILPEEIKSITPHPDFSGFLNPTVHDDLAVITLWAPLPVEIPTYSIYRGAPEIGEVVELVGYGETGDGVDGYVPGSGFITTKRVGANVVDALYADDETKGVAELWKFDFDGPIGNGPLGGPGLGAEVEATLGEGDSGGPGFIVDDGERLLFSVNNFVAGPGQDGRFGSSGGGVILSAYASWIDGFLDGETDFDLNRDGVVSGLDLMQVLDVWGEDAPKADFNRDGVVNSADLARIVRVLEQAE